MRKPHARLAPEPEPAPQDTTDSPRPPDYLRHLHHAIARGDAAPLPAQETEAGALLTRGYHQVLAVARGEAPLLAMPAGVADLAAGIRATVAARTRPATATGLRHWPKRRGLTAAVRALVALPQLHPIIAGVTLGPETVATADEVDALAQSGAALKACADELNRLASHKGRSLYLIVDAAWRVLEPLSQKDSDLRRALRALISYRKKSKGRAR